MSFVVNSVTTDVIVNMYSTSRVELPSQSATILYAMYRKNPEEPSPSDMIPNEKMSTMMSNFWANAVRTAGSPTSEEATATTNATTGIHQSRSIPNRLRSRCSSDVRRSLTISNTDETVSSRMNAGVVG